MTKEIEALHTLGHMAIAHASWPAETQSVLRINNPAYTKTTTPPGANHEQKLQESVPMTTSNTLSARIAAVLAVADNAPKHSPAAALMKFVEDRLFEHDVCETIDEAVDFLARKGELYEGDRWDGAIGVNLVENEDGDRSEQWGYGADHYTTCTLGDLLHSAEGHSTLPRWYDDEWVQVSSN